MLTFNDFARHPALARLCDRLAGMTALGDIDRHRLVESPPRMTPASRFSMSRCRRPEHVGVPFVATITTSADPPISMAVQRHHQLIVHTREAAR